MLSARRPGSVVRGRASIVNLSFLLPLVSLLHSSISMAFASSFARGKGSTKALLCGPSGELTVRAKNSKSTRFCACELDAGTQSFVVRKGGAA